MNKKIEMDDDFKSMCALIQNTLTWSKINFEIAKHLNYPGSVEKAKYFLNSYFLQNVASACSKLGIVELYKVSSLSSSDKISFDKLLKKITNGDYPEYKKCIPDDNITNWKQKIEEKSTIIENVKRLRNKVIAHADTSYKKVLINRFDDQLALIETFQSILDEICEITHIDVSIYKPDEHSLKVYNGSIHLDEIMRMKNALLRKF